MPSCHHKTHKEKYAHLCIWLPLADYYLDLASNQVDVKHNTDYTVTNYNKQQTITYGFDLNSAKCCFRVGSNG